MDEVVALLNDKLKLLQTLYQMSLNNRFKGTEEEADLYLTYVTERQAIFESMREIDEKLKSVQNDSSDKEQMERIKKEIMDTARKIYDIEEDNVKNMQVVYQKAKDELHKIENIRRFQYKRQGNTLNQPSGFFIDKKK